MTRTVSALTIAAGRPEHLANVVRGFAMQKRPPTEMVISVMQETPYVSLPDAPFPIRQIFVTGSELPLAAARNAAARAAQSEVLAFIDVDCIPAKSLCADYAKWCAPGAGMMMGEVMYLPGGSTAGGIDFEYFDTVAERHSDRQGPPPEGKARACNDYRCFWSLNFALHADDFAASGGFDETYVGYGGEDTDFGRTLDHRGIPISWISGARVYHQYHPHCMPPIHHLHSIVRNAEIFASKWGHRTMEHWLHAFRMMGLIENTSDGLRIVRDPGEEHFALCRQEPDRPYANTRRVLDILNSREGEIAEGRARTAEVEVAQSDLLSPAGK